jgi:hypothetical protein
LKDKTVPRHFVLEKNFSEEVVEEARVEDTTKRKVSVKANKKKDEG